MRSWIGVMKKCYLDTNLLLYYSDTESPFYSQATELVSRLLIQQWKLFISPLTLDEYFHNMIRFSRVSKDESFQNLKVSFNRIVKLPGIELINPSALINRQGKVINLMIKHQLRSRDAYHLFIMRENKIKYFATFDNDFEEIFKRGIIKKFS